MDYVIIAVLVIGFGLLGEVVRRLNQQIGALKGTVEAQAETGADAD